ncbi:MAG: biopolymer transporter ExbD, partial [Bacteroidetes bacterium]|nr:biopolymer transporter ExbD [Bacteroidota bacterium]
RDSESLTVLLGKGNKAFCYDGEWNHAVKNGMVVSAGYSISNGIGDIIRQKQKQMNSLKGKNGRTNLMLIIKATKEASYKNLMDALDEVLINDVKHYAVVDPEPGEVQFIENK